MQEKDSKMLVLCGMRRRIARMTKLKSQKLREQAVENLEELVKIAHSYAASDKVGLRDRREWARLETYVRQTINNIARSYDEVVIERKLSALKRVIDEELGRRDQPPKKESGKAKASEDRYSQ